MVSLLLRSVLFSWSKSLSFLGKNPVHCCSMAFSACIRYTIPKNSMAFRSSLFLTSNRLLPTQQFSGFKTKSVLKKRCKDCYMVKRRGRFYVYCKSNAKHKQRQL